MTRYYTNLGTLNTGISGHFVFCDDTFSCFFQKQSIALVRLGYDVCQTIDSRIGFLAVLIVHMSVSSVKTMPIQNGNNIVLCKIIKTL